MIEYIYKSACVAFIARSSIQTLGIDFETVFISRMNKQIPITFTDYFLAAAFVFSILFMYNIHPFFQFDNKLPIKSITS